LKCITDEIIINLFSHDPFFLLRSFIIKAHWKPPYIFPDTPSLALEGSFHLRVLIYSALSISFVYCSSLVLFRMQHESIRILGMTRMYCDFGFSLFPVIYHNCICFFLFSSSSLIMNVSASGLLWIVKWGLYFILGMGLWFALCRFFFFSFQGNGGGYMSFLYTPVTYMINGIQMDLYHISKL